MILTVISSKVMINVKIIVTNQLYPEDITNSFMKFLKQLGGKHKT